MRLSSVMAARNIPKENQKKVIIWGTVGAVIIRAIATLLVVYLLMLPGLHLIGGTCPCVYCVTSC